MNYDIDWNQLSKLIYINNNRWWIDQQGKKIERDPRQLILLAITELAEATEGLRKNLMDDHLPNYEMATVELADTLIRVLDLSAGFGIDIWENEDHSKPREEESSSLLTIVEDLVFLAYAFENEPCESLGDYVRYIINDIMEHAKRFDRNVIAAMFDKLEYNKTRADHSYEARAAENGKKF